MTKLVVRALTSALLLGATASLMPDAARAQSDVYQLHGAAPPNATIVNPSWQNQPYGPYPGQAGPYGPGNLAGLEQRGYPMGLRSGDMDPRQGGQGMAGPPGWRGPQAGGGPYGPGWQSGPPPYGSGPAWQQGMYPPGPMWQQGPMGQAGLGQREAIRDALRQLRQALQQDGSGAAEQALSRLEDTLGYTRQQRVQDSLDRIEQALQEENTADARQAVREIRETLRLQMDQGTQASMAQMGTGEADQRAMMRRALENVGFTDIRILDAAHLVRAETPDGDRVLLLANPGGLPVQPLVGGATTGTGTASGAAGSGSGTTAGGASSSAGGSTPGGSGGTTQGGNSQ